MTKITITDTASTTLSGIIWQAWSDTCASQYATTATCSNTIWGEWTTGESGSSIWRTTQPAVWRTWASNTYHDGTTVTYETAPMVQPARAADVSRVAAEAKARDLLLEHLTPEQAREFEASKSFVVVSQSGRRYRISLGRAHNVHELDEQGRPQLELCGHVGEFVPNGDNVLAQKLMLEADEEEYLQVANVWDLRNGRELVSRSGTPLRRVG